LLQSFGKFCKSKILWFWCFEIIGNQRTPGSHILEILERTLLFGSFGKYSTRNKIRSPTRVLFGSHFLI
jgi:hypothetical protein